MHEQAHTYRRRSGGQSPDLSRPAHQRWIRDYGSPRRRTSDCGGTAAAGSHTYGYTITSFSMVMRLHGGLRPIRQLSGNSDHCCHILCTERRRRKSTRCRLRRLCHQALQHATAALEDSRVLAVGCAYANQMHDPPRILIVDDNETNRDILSGSAPNLHGYELIQAADGEEAIVAAQGLSPDLILLDVMMPKLDGIEASAA